MRRGFPTRMSAATLLAAAMLIPAVPAAAQDDAHRHSNLVFRLRVRADLNNYMLYRAYRADRNDPESLLVERGDGYLGDDGQVDRTPAQCPALGQAVAALSELPLPAVHLGERVGSGAAVPRATEYDFSGFIGFANGGEGEVRVLSYAVPGATADPQVAWAQRFVEAFEACHAAQAAPRTEAR